MNLVSRWISGASSLDNPRLINDLQSTLATSKCKTQGPRPMTTALQDLVWSAMLEAARGSPDGTFNAASFSVELSRFAGTTGTVDDRLVQVILSGRPDCMELGGGRYQIINPAIERDKAIWAAGGVSGTAEAMSQAVELQRRGEPLESIDFGQDSLKARKGKL